MASYHLSVQLVKRSEGRSVVAMAAYRAGVLLKDERRDMEVDYRRRRGVVHAEILAPEDAAEWLLDRQSLWNGVERMEVRKDAQLAREINMALPHELTDAQRLELVREFVRDQFVSQGMIADIAIHSPVVDKGDDPRNHHAHVLLTMRHAGGGGLRRVKTRAWNSETMLLAWRRAWARHQNEALNLHGHRARVDHRSLLVRRAEASRAGNHRLAAVLERKPEIHVGPRGTKAGEKRPVHSRARPAGPKRRRRANKKPTRRSLNYQVFDQGSRAQWTMRTLDRNARAFRRVMRKRQRQIALLKQRRVYYSQVARLPEGRGLPPNEREFAIKRANARKRLAEIAYWLIELDLLFLALLRVHESQLVRRTIWSNRLARHRARAPIPGRGRPWMPE
jgi:hypothetical protein